MTSDDVEIGTMERVLSERNFDASRPIPTVFIMTAPLLEQGNERFYLAHTDRLSIFLTVWAPDDGENKMHSHTNEDHSFLVLDGAVEFTFQETDPVRLEVFQGIMLPRGCLYTFRTVSTSSAVLLRIGATVDPEQSPYSRKDENGNEVKGNSKDNNKVMAVRKASEFFPR